MHNERRVIYRQDCDRYHFLELLGEATERFGIRIRDYVPGRAPRVHNAWATGRVSTIDSCEL
ncbi:MAG TPA: hypothetical protein VKY92_24900 [Verrucomicrobiae bacterium]|nr:hypothetical protein [Verrucomicrobiae bacterium]